jgi:hypothetical protein
MDHQKHGHEINRRIVESWTREDNYRVKVTTWHDKNRKAFISNISECQIEKNEGYTMEKSVMYQSLNRLIQMEAVSRYNYEKMADFHAKAVTAVLDQINSLLSDPSRVAVGA